MKRLVASLAVAGLSFSLSEAVSAADLGGPAPVPMYTKAPVAVPFSWTGFYAGVSAGYGWSGDDVNSAVTSIFCNPVFIGAGCPQTGAATAAAVPLTYVTSPKGFIGGGQIGYNYQVNRVVLGAETDLSWANIKGSSTQAGGPIPIPGFANSVSASGAADQKLDLFGTVRARVGYTPVDPLLVFATGGLAYGRATSDTTVSESVGGACPACVPTAATGSTSSTLLGWTVGGGLEWAFAPHWSLKGEYLYYDLGSVSYALTPLGLTTAGTPATSVGISSTADFKGSIARAGINYRF
jgi:outer membrane immunogenic protein